MENIKYTLKSEKDAYIEINEEGKLAGCSCGDLYDVGEILGMNKVGPTVYIYARRNNRVYAYSVETGFPFVFEKEDKEA